MKEIHIEELTGDDESSRVFLKDIHEMEVTYHAAVAEGKIYVNPAVYYAVETNNAKKGDILGAARVAGIMAAKKSSELIPVCHTIALTECKLAFTMSEEEKFIKASCSTSCVGKKGVEIEALTGVSVALLTIFDMCKTMDHDMRIGDIRLVESRQRGNT